MLDQNQENSKESLSSTQMNVDRGHIKGDLSDKKYATEPVENTPFWIVGNTEEGFAITLGQYRVSQGLYKTAADAKDAIYERDWNILFNTVIAILRMDENIRWESTKDKYNLSGEGPNHLERYQDTPNGE